MGAINYGTSDYITMGIEPISEYDLEQDQDFMRELQAEVDEYGGTLDDAMRDYINDCEEQSWRDTEYIFEKYNFHFFTVKMEPGYYEGFYLDIKFSEYIFDSYADKRAAQKEVTKIGNFLRECAGIGLVQCFPGWCTAYKGYDETMVAIGKAVKSMREEVAKAPTWATYKAA